MAEKPFVFKSAHSLISPIISCIHLQDVGRGIDIFLQSVNAQPPKSSIMNCTTLNPMLQYTDCELTHHYHARESSFLVVLAAIIIKAIAFPRSSGDARFKTMYPDLWQLGAVLALILGVYSSVTILRVMFNWMAQACSEGLPEGDPGFSFIIILFVVIAVGIVLLDLALLIRWFEFLSVLGRGPADSDEELGTAIPLTSCDGRPYLMRFSCEADTEDALDTAVANEGNEELLDRAFGAPNQDSRSGLHEEINRPPEVISHQDEILSEPSAAEIAAAMEYELSVGYEDVLEIMVKTRR